MIININDEIVNEFNYLYEHFPEDIAQQMIEQDINGILEMHFDRKIYIDPIQPHECKWHISEKGENDG